MTFGKTACMGCLYAGGHCTKKFLHLKEDENEKLV